MCRFTDFPEQPEDFRKYVEMLLSITLTDRSKSYHDDKIPGFKFLDPQFWIVNEEECGRIAYACTRNLRRRKSTKSNKPTAKMLLMKSWLEFNKLATSNGGYEVRSASLLFRTVKGNVSMSLDDWASNELIAWLEQSGVLKGKQEPTKTILGQLEKKREEAAEKLGLDEIPSAQSDSFAKFLREWRNKTKSVRKKSTLKASIPAYKFYDYNRWIISVDECLLILDQIEKSLEALDESRLKGESLLELKAFVEEAVEKDGIELIRPDYEEAHYEEYGLGEEYEDEDEDEEYEYEDEEYEDETEADG
jgi:hypothetical protein